MLCMIFGVGCERSAPPESTATSAAPIVSAAPPKAEPPRRLIPQGPMMEIMPGKGVGPIRFGATFATVERLMELPCETRTETQCAYPNRGVVLEFEKGVVATIDVFRGGRALPNAKGPDDVYNYFNGAIYPDILPGMIPDAVQEALGKPERVEKLEGPNPTNTMERHFYDGAILDYDLNSANQKLMLGRIRLVPLRGAKVPGLNAPAISATSTVRPPGAASSSPQTAAAPSSSSTRR